jgi:hypothetical protein
MATANAIVLTLAEASSELALLQARYPTKVWSDAPLVLVVLRHLLV